MSPSLGASSSSQSTSTRIGILISLYLLILICFPYARSLVSVHRRPIDDKAIAQWQRRQERACPVTLPALVGVQGFEVGGDEGWTRQLDGRVEELLQRATDAQHGEEKWCLKWDVQSSGGGGSAASKADFIYTVGSSATSSSSSAVPLSLPRNISSFAPDSVALALARRIALDLDLPAKHLLVDVEAKSPTGIEDASQDSAVDPQPEGAAPLAEVQTHAPSAAAQQQATKYAALPAISLPDDDDVLRRLKEQPTTSTGATSSTSEVSIPLPPRLILSLHVLNEDLPSSPFPLHPTSANISDYLLSPLSSQRTFISSLQSELADVHAALDGVTRIGFETHWGLGAKTRGVKWEEIAWMTEETWVEWVERSVEEEYEEEYDDGDNDDDGAEDERQDGETQDEAGDEALTSSQPPRPKRTRTRTLTRTRTERVPITHRRPISKSVHALSPDQLEIFVDEGAWGLTDTAMAAQVAAASSSTSPASSRNVTRSSHRTRFPDLFARDAAQEEEEDDEQGETRTLHLVLYKPSSEHTPLIYLPETETDGDEEAQQQHSKTAAAVAQEADPVHWGWTVPGWGGVVIYNGVEHARQGEEATAGLRMLSPSAEDQQDILDLWGRQVRSLLGLTPTVDEDHATRLAHFHLLRRTLLTRISSSLESLSALSRVLTRLPSLEVGHGVQESVRLALQALEELDHSARFSSSSPRTLRSLFPLAARAERHAGEAFHHHRMVGLLYFPAEHTWAVYTPLFGPLVVPLVLAGGREFKGWMRRRRRRSRGRAAVKRANS